MDLLEQLNFFAISVWRGRGPPARVSATVVLCAVLIVPEYINC